MNLSLSTWAIAPLSVVLRDHARADQVRLTLLRDGPIYERVHVEAIYRDGHCEETTVHETPLGIDHNGHAHSVQRWSLQEIELWMKALGFLPEQIATMAAHAARDPRRRPVDPNECQETCG